VTLVWFNPGTLKAQAVFLARERLTEAERIAVRRGYGEAEDLAVPISDSILEGEMTSDSIPMALRVPAERFALRSA
jgi:hypothetical protein